MSAQPPRPTPRSAEARHAGDGLLDEVLAGLSQSPKRLASKFFYDQRGSQLFERICEQPEYYLTRVELSIMQASIAAMATALGPRLRLVEYGSGNGSKTRLLLRHLQDPVACVPVEISGAALTSSAARLAQAFPLIELLPVCADFTQAIVLPRAARAPRQTAVYFPGSTLGNFAPDTAVRLLQQMRSEAAQGGGELPGGVLIGVDLVKDAQLLEAAYNDAAGVTAEFTLNLLVRLNHELGANFQPAAFRHRARWHALASRIETHLVSARAQRVRIGDRQFQFDPGEAMLVEFSSKYTIASLAALAQRAGLRVRETWTDPARMFAVCWLTAV